MYTYIYICRYIYVHTYTYIHTFTHMHTHIHLCTYKYIRMYYTCVRVHMHTHTRTHWGLAQSCNTTVVKYAACIRVTLHHTISLCNTPTQQIQHTPRASTEPRQKGSQVCRMHVCNTPTHCFILQQTMAHCNTLKQQTIYHTHQELAQSRDRTVAKYAARVSQRITPP